jgi:hypothetical protein
LLGALLALALMARIGYLAWRGPVVGDDYALYQTIARTLKTTGELAVTPGAPTTRCPPLYPAFIALMGRDPAWVSFAQVVFDVMITGGIFVLSRCFACRRNALLAAGWYAIHPGAVAGAATLMTEGLFGPLLLAGVGLTVLALSARRAAPALALSAGFVFGAAGLCRTIGAPLALVVTLVVWRVARSPRLPLLIGLPVVLLLGLWSARCSRLAHSFVFVQGGGSVNVAAAGEDIAWSALASDPQTEALTRTDDPVALAAADKQLTQRTLLQIRRRPWAWIKRRANNYPHLMLTNFAMFFGDFATAPSLRNDGWRGPALGRLLLSLLFCAAPLLVAARGAWAGRRSPIVALAAASCLATAVLHLPIYCNYRFWIPVLPLVALLCAAAAPATSDPGYDA